MTTPYMGHMQRFGINTGSVTSMFGFCTVGKHGTHLEREGTRGTRAHSNTDVIDGPYTVSGQIIINPTNTDLSLLETYIIGASGAVTNTLGEFHVVIDRGNDVYTYSNCKITRAVYSGRQGELLRLVCDVIGKTESATGTRPSEPTTATPFAFDDITLTLASSAREVEEFELVVDNHMIPDRFQHQQTVTDIPEADRTVTLRTVHSWSTNTSGLYSQAVGGSEGSLVLNDGTNTRTYTFGKLQVPDESPPLADRGPMMLTLNMVARKDTDSMEIART